jgi:metal-responsive CopG/Arc/MetJ family transcriptional regulator
LIFFYCHTGSTGNIGSTMQSAYTKTSVSLPNDLADWLRRKSQQNGGTPISRLIAAAIRDAAQNEKRRTKK